MIRALLSQRLVYARASLVFAQKAAAAERLKDLIAPEVPATFAQVAFSCAAISRDLTNLQGQRGSLDRIRETVNSVLGSMAILTTDLAALQRYAVAGIFAVKQRDVLQALSAVSQQASAMQQRVLDGESCPLETLTLWDVLSEDTIDPLAEAALDAQRAGTRLVLPELAEALAQLGLSGGLEAQKPLISPKMPVLEDATVTPVKESPEAVVEPPRYSREWFIWREQVRHGSHTPSSARRN